MISIPLSILFLLKDPLLVKTFEDNRFIHIAPVCLNVSSELAEGKVVTTEVERYWGGGVLVSITRVSQIA